MSVEATKQQIRTWIEDQIRKAQSPDLREQLKRARKKRAQKAAARFGL